MTLRLRSESFLCFHHISTNYNDLALNSDLTQYSLGKVDYTITIVPSSPS